MPYVTQIDLENRFGTEEVLVSNDLDGDGIIDTDVLNARIADVEAIINHYLSQQYAIPLSSVPAIIVKIACDLVRERFYVDIDPPETAMKNASNSRKMLKDYGTGQIGLPGIIISSDEQSRSNAPLLTKATTQRFRDASNDYRAFGGGGF